MRLTMARFWSVGLIAIAVTSGVTRAQDAPSPDRQVDQILTRVAEHDFHPLKEGFTQDRELETDGIANFNASDWRVRLLAIRELIRIGQPAAEPLTGQLKSSDLHVRQIAAKTLGLLQHEAAAPHLRELLRNDPEMVVRAQAALALGRIGGEPSLELLRQMAGNEEATRDVRHRCQLAAYRIEHQINTNQQLRKAYRAMDSADFGQLEVGQAPPDFTLTDTSGKQHRLSDYIGRQPIVLIWIFADWCPVCHGEFDELIKLREKFEKHDIQVFTIQTQDRYRARVMTGEAPVEPPYWFRDEPPQQRYRTIAGGRTWSTPPAGSGPGSAFSQKPLPCIRNGSIGRRRSSSTRMASFASPITAPTGGIAPASKRRSRWRSRQIISSPIQSGSSDRAVPERAAVGWAASAAGPATQSVPHRCRRPTPKISPSKSSPRACKPSPARPTHPCKPVPGPVVGSVGIGPVV